MFLRDVGPTQKQTFSKITKQLSENFGVKLRPFAPKANMDKMLTNVNENLIRIKGSTKKFHLDPEYAKFLGIKGAIETMIAESMYAESPSYINMKEMITASVQELMDSGYTVDEACKECMNRYRRDDRFAYDDEHVLPIVLQAANNYYEGCKPDHDIQEISGAEEMAVETKEEKISEAVVRGVAKVTGAKTRAQVQERINAFAKITGRTPEAVVKFLSGLNEENMAAGIKMFGRKIAEQNQFNRAKKAAIKRNLSEFKFNGVTHSTGLVEKNVKVDLSALNEEVDMEQAEVVMAVRAIGDDLQDQVEKVGRTINEDMPAIVKQMQNEMGADAATQFQQQMEGVLDQLMQSLKDAKSGVDQAAAGLTGEQPVGGDTTAFGGDDTFGDPMADLGGEDDLGGELGPDGADVVGMNEPAMAGPADEPLGRAPVDI